MKYERKEIGRSLITYKLVKDPRREDEKFQRMALYNDLLFQNMENLTGRYPKTVVIINENNTGGIVYSSYDFINKAFENLKKYNRLDVTEFRRMNTYSRKISKIAFSCKERKKLYGREGREWR